MANLPAFCFRCGTAFRSGFGVSGDARIFTDGCTSGPCPICGGFGSIPDGEYKAEDHLITLLSGPAASFLKIKELHEILNKAKAAGDPPEKTLASVEKSSPSLGAIGNFLKPEILPLYIGLLMQLISLLIQSQQPAPMSKDDAISLVSAAISMASSNAHLSAPTINNPTEAPCQDLNPKIKQDGACTHSRVENAQKSPGAKK